MQTLKFKTNINCGGCVKAITPTLTNAAIHSWQVDTANPDKVLTIATDLPATQVQAMVEQAGFEAREV